MSDAASPDVVLLDTKGLSCPLPVLRARKAIKTVPAGATLKVLATDPGAVKDFEAFCQATGSEFGGATESGGVYTILVRRPA
jgi:tRNA 2-thiouridine synthesizing protein A